MVVKSSGIVIEAKNVHVDIKEKHILQDVSCRVRSGEILAIMGPTGRPVIQTASLHGVDLQSI